MLCGKCGSDNPATNAVCGQCGAALTAGSRPGPQASPGAADRTAAAQPSVTHGPAPEAVPFAGFWRRFLAILIDDVIVSVALVMLAVATPVVAGIGRAGAASFVLVAYVLGPWLYCALMWSASTQATVGKMALGIKVTDEAGRRIEFGRATGRYFAQILTGLSLGVGYAMAVFTRRRQALHDKVAGTLVVREQFSPEAIAASPDAPPRPIWASALVVIAVVLFNPFGVGVFAAIAIPAYQDYTIRTQVTEGLNLAAPIKAAVSHARIDGAEWEAITTESLGSFVRSGKYTAQIDVVSGAIVIEYGNAANKALAGKSISLVPYDSTAGQGGRTVIWVCGRATAPVGVTAAFPDAEQYTTVADKFLPRACRSQSGAASEPGKGPVAATAS
jgi:uncharacterized RDD family membrane protein YckC/Tfp pilus assembly major pilin PilA